ncbi:MAG: wax ester/triacylglycerol synthase family O-acyltransferase [Acidimicrobiia bacterium]|nr:wax ester/triacylglycerol synthase family O-acyltransferase [Acidimicrobiia bacterium]
MAEHGRRERAVRNDRHMTDVEALMWNVDKDPYLSSNFGTVTIFDQPVDAERLRPRLERMVDKVPRLRQRVAPVLGRLAPPEWQDDPDFDLDYHLRHLALPAPGDTRQLFDLATRIVADPFDRTRPLWEFVIVDGLADGRGAMVQKMHHTITDGEGGIRMSEQFVDLERDPPPPEPVDTSAWRSESPPAERHADLLAAAGDALAHTARRSLGATRRAAPGAVSVAAAPQRLPAVGRDVVEFTRSVLRQATVTDHAHSPLWCERSLQRHLDVLDVPFDDAYRTAKALGGSLNDLFVAAVAGAAGAYHRQLGVPVADLRMAMPVSTRSDRSAGGNSFVPTRVLVPVAERDPLQRFLAVHERLNQTKSERAIGMVDMMAGVVNALPTSVVVRFVRQQAETVDFTTSNVRAAPFDLFIGGARLEATYPLGPLVGTAVNVTMMSYCGTLNIGVHFDAGAVAEPAVFMDALRDSFDELLDTHPPS